MKQPLLLGFLLATLLLTPSMFPFPHRILEITVGSSPSASSDSWPTFHHDTARSGYTSDQAPASPKVLWSYQTAGQIETSPLIANGTVYFSSYDNYFYALNQSTGSLLWRTRIGVATGSPAIYGGSVYAGGYYMAGGFPQHTYEQLYRLNASTGVKIWNVSVGGVDVSILPVKDNICSGQVGANGVVGKGGGVYCLNAWSGSMLWKSNVTFPSELAYADGLLYMSSESSGIVYALNATDGSVAWQYQTPTIVTGGPTVHAGVLYAGGFAGSFPAIGQFSAFNAMTGSVIWNTSLAANGPPAMAGGVLILNGGTGVTGLNATSGSQIWGFNFHNFGVSESFPAVGGDIAVVGGGAKEGIPDPTIYALDVKTGKLVWSLPVGLAANSSPAISGGIVYVGADDGKLYAITSAGESLLSWPSVGYLAGATAAFFVAIAILLHRRRKMHNVARTLRRNVSNAYKGINANRLC